MVSVTSLINTPLINNFRYNQTTLATGNTELAAGAIISIADGGNGQIVITTGAPHGLLVSYPVEISGTTSYNGTYTVISVTSTTFNIAAVFVSTETGVWQTANLSVGATAGDPLDFGKLYFYDATDKTKQLDTYLDSSRTVTNPNPIILSNVGTFPPIYLQSLPYYIVIKDKFNNTIETLDNYYGALTGESSGDDSKKDLNLLSDGQFVFKFDFNTDKTKDGLISNDITPVSDAWFFYEDSSLNTENYVTFPIVAPNTLEGDPTYVIQLNSTTADENETKKDFRQKFGEVNSFSGETLTFSGLFDNNNSTPISIELLLLKSYGSTPTEQVITSLTTFTVTAGSKKYSYSFTIDEDTGQVIDEDNGLWIIIRVALQETCSVTLTNLLLYQGSSLTAIYPNFALNEDRAMSLGTSTLDKFGYNESYNFLFYYNGNIKGISETGKIAAFFKDKNPPYTLECDGRTLDPTKFTNGIQNDRLYQIIGNTFGGTGDTKFYKYGKNTLRWSVDSGKKEKNVPTVGTLGTKITLTRVSKAFPAGITATQPTVNQLQMDFDYTPTATVPVASVGSGATALTVNLDGNVPVPHPAGNRYECTKPVSGTIPDTAFSGNFDGITGNNAVTIASSTATQIVLDFNATDITKYMAAKSGTTATIANTSPPQVPAYSLVNFIEFATVAHTTRGWYGAFTWPGLNSVALTSSGGVIEIGTDSHGFYGVPIISGGYDFKVKFLTKNTLQQNIKLLVDAINSSDTWQIVFNEIPANTGTAEYFLFSSDMVDYYVWYDMTGSQADPAVASRTGIKITATGTQTPDSVAQLTVDGVGSQSFNIPTQAQVRTELGITGTPTTPNYLWYIYQ